MNHTDLRKAGVPVRTASTSRVTLTKYPYPLSCLV
jgi:hypothetical protein